MLPEDQKEVLRLAQGDLPLCDRPFAAWAEEAGTGEDALIDAIAALRDKGVIRRFGGVFDARKMGLFTTLVGARISSDKLESALSRITALDGSTHVYLRDGEINVWFTLAADSAEAAYETVRSLEEEGLAEKAWSMPMKRKFKLEVRFAP